MRKEVKLGTAIGGVLVAVLIVYAVVNKGHSKKATVVVLEDGKSKTGEQAATPGQTGAGDPGPAAPAGDPAPVPRDPVGDSAQGNPPTVPGTGVGPSHSEETADSTPPASSATDWKTLLSAENPEISTPVHTRTPDPATDGAGGNNPVPPADIHGTSVVIDPPHGTGVPSHASDPGSHAGPSDNGTVTLRPSGSQTHRIQSGETFSSISKAFYGDSRYFSEIAKANPTVNPNKLKLGTTINLPDKALFKTEKKEATAGTSTPAGPSATPHPTTPTATAVDARTEYRVQSTDSLYKISLKLYGTPNKVDAIYQLNKQLIGVDPARLKLNMVLKLPEAPNSNASTSATASR
jgi:nucleoid-associated protein YgaU